MKTLIKPLLVAFSLSFVTLSAALADGTPAARPAAVAAYKTGIYTTIEGKLNIALDKETSGAVDIRMKSADGVVLFSQHLGKKETGTRVRLDMSALQDGNYQVEITNGVETTVHNVTLSTQQPSASSRLVAIK
ncbi:hypothetical protein [Spirosoma endophyticum]|uniref:Por secretion system C-terminal sorting domain-containing protein n=1 Tax=Spirosoma endophyticum TaxID=662367 RepID=A0A1I1R278_9BACT|nr:hypothetical protein [Spirosoma endophyticum]SFD26228.1 hypothetical protein SAMN05216167_104143 [Spirosoma endophyticum]